MATPDFNLSRNCFGHLTLTTTDGQTHDNVMPIRSFPVQAPDEGISIVSGDGREVAWIGSIAALSGPIRQLIDEELESHEFMPEIQSIAHTTSYGTPCTWHVATNKGETNLVLRGEEDIRRIGPSALLVVDHHGIHFLIRDMLTLDKHSRKILDRFL